MIFNPIIAIVIARCSGSASQLKEALHTEFMHTITTTATTMTRTTATRTRLTTMTATAARHRVVATAFVVIIFLNKFHSTDCGVILISESKHIVAAILSVWKGYSLRCSIVAIEMQLLWPFFSFFLVLFIHCFAFPLVFSSFSLALRREAHIVNLLKIFIWEQ